MLAFGGRLPSLIIIMIIIGALTVRPARAQDLDQDKSGAKLFATMLNTLERTGGRYGLQTMCEGGGTANVTIIERL